MTLTLTLSRLTLLLQPPPQRPQSIVLRNVRMELVSKSGEFAEIGLKAALAAATYAESSTPDIIGRLPAHTLPSSSPHAPHRPQVRQV